MSEHKYMIKNCPAYCYLGKECHSKEGQYGASCCEVTDCVMKQIVNHCKDVEEYSDDYYTRPILEKLDIQEVE